MSMSLNVTFNLKVNEHVNDYKLYAHVIVIMVYFRFFLQPFPFRHVSLTIVTVETSPNKLVVVCDLVDNST